MVEKLERVYAIDIFRGLCILLMIFFSMLIRLAHLPDLLTHNQPDSFHLGDMVLPMFLFASGMSLVFFLKKRSGKPNFALDVFERIGMIIIVCLFITPFSAGGILSMDEIMLYLVLFIPSIFLWNLDEKILLGISYAIYALYGALLVTNLMPNWDAVGMPYLGGYQAAIFYLPVMLAGVMFTKRLINGQSTRNLLLVYCVTAVILLLLISPHKMELSPSFMALSIAVAALVFEGIRSIESSIRGHRFANALEYMGKRPLRFWVLMFVVILIPLSFYAIAIGLTNFPLNLDWRVDLILTILAMPFLYILSKIIDRILEFQTRIMGDKSHLDKL